MTSVRSAYPTNMLIMCHRLYKASITQNHAFFNLRIFGNFA